MSTTLVKPAEVERKWYLLDAAGKSLGHVAAEAAVLLRGKQKVDYTPNVDCGDFVVVINCDQAVLTGKKLEEVIAMFRGLSCAERPTSCPDQMAQALEQYLTGAAQPQ